MNVERQMTNVERSPKLEARSPSFVIRISSFLRHSHFVIRHFSLRHLPHHLSTPLAVAAWSRACSPSAAPVARKWCSSIRIRCRACCRPRRRMEQVIDVVNRNSSAIQSFSTNRASISGAGFPSLTASVAFQRARRFRLQAGHRLRRRVRSRQQRRSVLVLGETQPAAGGLSTAATISSPTARPGR